MSAKYLVITNSLNELSPNSVLVHFGGITLKLYLYQKKVTLGLCPILVSGVVALYSLYRAIMFEIIGSLFK